MHRATLPGPALPFASPKGCARGTIIADWHQIFPRSSSSPVILGHYRPFELISIKGVSDLMNGLLPLAFVTSFEGRVTVCSQLNSLTTLQTVTGKPLRSQIAAAY